MTTLPIRSILNAGSAGLIVEAECHLSNGLPNMTIVGLGNKAVDEARERIRSAFSSCKIPMPKKRIIINLAPADIPKESTSLDLAIALSIIQAAGDIKQNINPEYAVIGELGLDGNVRSVRGLIGKLLAGKRSGISTFVIPHRNLPQASLIPNINVIPVRTISQLYEALLENNESLPIVEYKHQRSAARKITSGFVLEEIAGQERAKRAMTIAAAGGHNLFLSGPPGTGKSMLAKTLPSLLPPLSNEEILEITHIHSLTNNNYDELVTERPFRSPHHSSSYTAMVGGGSSLRPGEISLSHNGVLLLDEMPEFGRSSIEALRQPLENRVISVARAKEVAEYPASFILVATANPCPCGYYNTSRACECPAYRIAQYRSKISGPIMDRIDLHVDVEEVQHDKLLQAPKNTNTTDRAKFQIINARKMQAQRFQNPLKLNAHMTNDDIRQKCNICSASQQVLNQAAERLQLSARSYMRVVKVARTIADLENSSLLKAPHMAEALQYRPLNLYPG